MARAHEGSSEPVVEPEPEPEEETAAPELEKEQAEALGAGREEAKDKAERESAEPDNGPGFEPTTPSALALAEVGNLDGEDVKPDEVGDALAHGEAYQAAKKKHRWG